MMTFACARLGIGVSRVASSGPGRARRDAQFAAGRMAAARALAAFDPQLRDLTVGRGAAGEPVFPEGVVGSIAHTSRCAISVAARSTGDVVTMGIDIEPLVPLDTELLPSVLSEGELEALAGLRPPRARERAKIVFCAKESAYKAQFPLTREFVDFPEATVTFKGEGQFGVASSHRALARIAPAMSGCVWTGLGHVVALTVVSRFALEDPIGCNDAGFILSRHLDGTLGRSG